MPGIKRAIDVFPIRLRASEASAAPARALLSAREIERADAFRSDDLRRAFVLRRAALRVLLGRMLGVAPGAVAVQIAENGKPEIAGSNVCFNVSASGGLAIIALTRDCDIGIDVEAVRSIPETLDVAQQFLGATERAELERLPEPARAHAFAVRWTRREAYLKARGAGLSAALDDRPDASWTIGDLDVSPRFACALAYRDAVRDVRIAALADAGDVLAAC